MLSDAMACKPLEDWRNLRIEKFRDNTYMHDIQVWFYMDTPFMVCNTWMDPTDQQLKFMIERIDDDAKKIIT